MGGFFIGEEMWETSGASAENLGGGAFSHGRANK